jgi:hypothetical protein
MKKSAHANWCGLNRNGEIMSAVTETQNHKSQYPQTVSVAKSSIIMHRVPQ